jgi:hypothetical protein
MTKKILFGMMAATMMIATSCENELDLGTNAGENAQVTFSVGTPEIATRAYSDGQTATVLQYAVYDAEGKELTDLTVTDAEIHGSTTVNLQLTTGNTYSVIFWAAAENAPYTVDFAAKTMTVDYDKAVSNDETRDAFYKYHTFTVKGAQTETIELKRPFAQLNIGTADYAASTSAGYTPVNSAVTVKSIYNTLNLWDGEVSGETEVTYDYAAIAKNEAFPVAGYEYLAMNYLLVAADKALVDVEFAYTETDATAAKTRTVGSVPVQRNYRTNIYGNLLTSDVDINVEIKPEYDEPAYDASLQYAVENGGEVTLSQDVVLENPLKVKAGKVVVIDLNGYTISGTDKNTAGNYYLIDNRGTLTIKDNSAAKSGAITLTAESNREWNASSVVVANNPGGKLVIDGGTIEHLGGSDMAYAIDNLTNGKGTYAETVINGGTIKSPYRAVRQFLNGVEAQNILTVNGGVIEGTNKSIWMQDPSAKSNSGKLIVEGGELKGDVYLYVTAGSTEWPVEVSIKAECVKNEVVTGNVPEGYLVALVNGYHIVAYADVVVEDVNALKDALANGENVLLSNDIAVAKSDAGSNGYGVAGISQLNGGIIDGNGNDVSVDAWGTWDSAINTTGGTIKNVNVIGGMRGIFVSHNSTYSDKVILENVTIDGTIYTLSCDQGTNKGLEAYNSTFNGWTSYAATIGAVKFDGCSFGEGQGYAFCRPYAATEFVNCDFAAGYEIDARAAVTFENCTLNGEALTSANLSTLVTGNIANATIK